MASLQDTATPGKPKRDILISAVRRESKQARVTFASSHTSISIPAEYRLSPKKARERTRNRKDTPHKKTTRTASSPSPALHGKKPRLVESGAVRVQIARYTNPRRGVKHGSGRLIDQGAVRVNVTRHTTPRRLYATHKRMWSPPPSSVKRKVLPQSEKIPNRNPPVSTSTTTTTTPSKHRSNASIGGHRFRASMSPKCTTPMVATEFYKENEDNRCLETEKSLKRTLFD